MSPIVRNLPRRDPDLSRHNTGKASAPGKSTLKSLRSSLSTLTSTLETAIATDPRGKDIATWQPVRTLRAQVASQFKDFERTCLLKSITYPPAIRSDVLEKLIAGPIDHEVKDRDLLLTIATAYPFSEQFSNWCHTTAREFGLKAEVQALVDRVVDVTSTWNERELSFTLHELGALYFKHLGLSPRDIPVYFKRDMQATTAAGYGGNEIFINTHFPGVDERGEYWKINPYVLLESYFHEIRHAAQDDFDKLAMRKEFSHLRHDLIILWAGVRTKPNLHGASEYRRYEREVYDRSAIELDAGAAETLITPNLWRHRGVPPLEIMPRSYAIGRDFSGTYKDAHLAELQNEIRMLEIEQQLRAIDAKQDERNDPSSKQYTNIQLSFKVIVHALNGTTSQKEYRRLLTIIKRVLKSGVPGYIGSGALLEALSSIASAQPKLRLAIKPLRDSLRPLAERERKAARNSPRKKHTLAMVWNAGIKEVQRKPLPPHEIFLGLKAGYDSLNPALFTRYAAMFTALVKASGRIGVGALALERIRKIKISPKRLIDNVSSRDRASCRKTLTEFAHALKSLK